MLFNKMAATTWFYLRSYFCFRKHANSNNCFTCGFDIGPFADVTAAAEVLYQPHVLEVVAFTGVPANDTTGTTEIVALTGVSEVLKIAYVPKVLAVAAQPPI